MGTWVLLLSKLFRGNNVKKKLVSATVFCVLAAACFIAGTLGLINSYKISILWIILGAAMLCLRFIPLSKIEDDRDSDSSVGLK